MKIIFLCLIFCIFGCATKKVVPENQSGHYFGRMRVLFDGKDITESCYFQVEDPSGDTTKVFLPSSGLFKGKGRQGEYNISRFSCNRGLSNHYYNFTDDDTFAFDVNSQRSFYLGDTTVHWESGDFNPAWLILSVTTLAWIGTEAKSIKISKKNNIEITMAELGRSEIGSAPAQSSPLRIPAGFHYLDKKVAKKDP